MTAATLDMMVTLVKEALLWSVAERAVTVTVLFAGTARGAV